MKTDPVIEVRGLTMAYGSVQAVRGVDLEVHRGEVFAFLGPNGAGKTTTVEILEGYRRRSGGEVRVLGVDPSRAGPEWRARIGVVLQESELEAELTVSECVALYAGYYPHAQPVGETIALVGLEASTDVRCGRLSGGQRRRLDVALALVGDPELVFLDEPTTGFDPSARRAAWEVITGLRRLGKTIFLTTHYMEEAEYLADRIQIISGGRSIAEGTPATLGGRDQLDTAVAFTLGEGHSAAELPPDLLGPDATLDGRRITIASSEPLRFVASLAAWSTSAGVKVDDLQVSRPSLEEIYLRLTGAADTNG